jgi:hypothetical protein
MVEDYGLLNILLCRLKQLGFQRFAAHILIMYAPRRFSGIEFIQFGLANYQQALLNFYIFKNILDGLKILIYNYFIDRRQLYI